MVESCNVQMNAENGRYSVIRLHTFTPVRCAHTGTAGVDAVTCNSGTLARKNMHASKLTYLRDFTQWYSICEKFVEFSAKGGDARH